MLKHGSSHGFSVLVCSIIAALLIKYLEPKLPDFFSWLEQFSEIILLRLKIEPSEFLSVIVVTAVLAFVWGIFFKVASRN